MIQRWEPFRELEAMRERMARMMEELWGRPEEVEAVTMTPAMDVTETDQDYRIRASLPGVKPEDIDVTVSGNTVNIRASRKEEEERRGATFLMRERRAGTFSRTVTLPEPIEADKVQAVTEYGVLTVTIPKSEVAKAKRIEVKAGAAARELPAGEQGRQQQM